MARESILVGSINVVPLIPVGGGSSPVPIKGILPGAINPGTIDKFGSGKALRERKMRLEVGQGLEGDLTDLFSKRLLDSIRPELKLANYQAASLKILTGVAQQLKIDLNELQSLTPKKSKVKSVTGRGFVLLFFLFIFLTLLQKFLPVSGRHYQGRRRPFDVYYGGGSSHGRSSGGFGGGGGWSGGGGGFSGGGASSDW